MRPVILYRQFDTPADEVEAARKYFFVTNSRMDIQRDDLVIGRYSVLPFYEEQERDIRKVGGQLINTYAQHQYIADLRQWYVDLHPTPLGSALTPKTWMSSEEMMDDKDYQGAYVVKGVTNSKKHSWSTHMFANDKAYAIKVMMRLQEDSLIGQQQIIFREYVPLKHLGTGIGGMPITKEFRFFFCRGELLCGAFYWSSHVGDIAGVPDASEVPLAFLGEVNDRIRDKTNFVVVDIAQTAMGEWLVVELNDGQMSGISENNPLLLYRRLQEVLGG